MSKPEYDQWAEALLQEIYHAPGDEGHRVAIIKEHLLKAVQRGYIDGTDFGWVHEQEAYPQEQEKNCIHESDKMGMIQCQEYYYE